MQKKRSSPAVSRMGQQIKRPMASRIKEKRGLIVSHKSFRSFGSEIFVFVRRHLILSGIAGVLGLFVVLLYFTPVFSIKRVDVVMDERSGCLTKEYIEKYIFLHIPSVWSHYFFSDEELRSIHPCLDKLSVQWNPFSPYKIVVKIVARRPVLRVLTQPVKAEANLTAQKFFSLSSTSQTTYFMLPNGSLVQLDAEPNVPTISLKYSDILKVDELRFTTKQIESILQLIEFLKKEFQFQPELEISNVGVIHFSSPFAAHVYTSLHQDLQMQLGSLQAILSTSTIDRSKIDSIDVRSGDVFIKYKR